MRLLIFLAATLLMLVAASTNAVAQSSPQLADVKKMIDSHFVQLKRLSNQNADTEALNKALEDMASSEVAAWDKMSESDRSAAKSYADRKIKPPSKPKPTNLATTAAAGGPCQIVSFIVCYRKCCANGAGNGAAACVGGVTCQNCWSESCPP